jgi:hypothetical protein
MRSISTIVDPATEDSAWLGVNLQGEAHPAQDLVALCEKAEYKLGVRVEIDFFDERVVIGHAGSLLPARLLP